MTSKIVTNVVASIEGMPNVLLKITDDPSLNEITVSVGGFDKFCATIGIKRDSSSATLSWVEYNKLCAIAGELPRGEGTNHLIKTAVEFIKRSFTWVKTITLFDNAKIKCNVLHNSKIKEVPLSYYYLTIDGESYYEKRIGAKLATSTINEEYMLVKEMLSSPFGKESWGDLIKRSVFIPEELHSLFDDSETMQIFFQRLYALHKPPEYCKYIAGWIESYIVGLFSKPKIANALKEDWIITVKDKSYLVDFSDLKKGGIRRRKTNKNKCKQKSGRCNESNKRICK